MCHFDCSLFSDFMIYVEFSDHIQCRGYFPRTVLFYDALLRLLLYQCILDAAYPSNSPKAACLAGLAKPSS